MSLIKFQFDDIFLLQNLANGQLFFNNVFNFNDPFEGIFRYRLSSDKEAFRQFYIKHYQGNPDKYKYYLTNKGELEKKINKSFDWRHQNNGVCCFSDSSCNRDILMWSHYANKHRGVCLVFNDNLQFVTPPHMNSDEAIVAHPNGPHPVTYTRKYYNEDPLEHQVTATNFLTTKFDTWGYEHEQRFISPKSGAYHFNKQSLTQVIFGLRTTPDLKSTIRNIVENDPTYSVEFLKVELAEGDFAFELISDDFEY